MKFKTKDGRTFDLNDHVVKSFSDYQKELKKYAQIAGEACVDHRMDIFYGLVKSDIDGSFMQANFFQIPVERSEIDNIIKQFYGYQILIEYADRHSVPMDELYRSDIGNKALTGEEYELFCKRSLIAAGYSDVQTTPRSGDHGADLIAYMDGKKYVVQCKYYTGNVGFSAIQEVLTAKELYHADYAVVMTNSTFTKQATEDAKRLGIALISNAKP